MDRIIHTLLVMAVIYISYRVCRHTAWKDFEKFFKDEHKDYKKSIDPFFTRD